MKNLMLLISVALLFSGCKKIIEKAQEDAVIKKMTSGQWKVVSFIDEGTNVTAEFSPYKFQFLENRTVQAIKNNAVEITGTWDANADNYTITSNFSTTANPLVRLNRTFQITDAGDNYVVAITTSAPIRSLRLEKV